MDKNKALIETIGRAIAKYRQAVGLTQAELAEILGISNDAVSRMERGKTIPTVVRLVELAEIFRCDVADLITDSSNRSLDQARSLERILQGLDAEERVLLLDLVDKLIQWKTIR